MDYCVTVLQKLLLQWTLHNPNSLVLGVVQISESFRLVNVYIFNGAYSIFYSEGLLLIMSWPVVLAYPETSCTAQYNHSALGKNHNTNSRKNHSGNSRKNHSC